MPSTACSAFSAAQGRVVLAFCVTMKSRGLYRTVSLLLIDLRLFKLPLMN